MNSDIDVPAIAAAVSACPGVSSLAARSGPTTDDAGSQLPGIILTDHTIEIAVIAFFGRRLSEVVKQIETVVRPLIAHQRLVVTIEDLDREPKRPDSSSRHQPGGTTRSLGGRGRGHDVVRSYAVMRSMVWSTDLANSGLAAAAHVSNVTAE